MPRPTSTSTRSQSEATRLSGFATAQASGLRGWWSRFIGPAGVSVGVHAVFLFMLAIAAWTAVETSRGEPVRHEFEAKVVREQQPDGPAGGFRFPGRAHLDRPDSAAAHHQEETIEDLASLLEEDPLFKPKPIDSGGSGLGAIAVEGLRRSDVVGVGSGGGIGEGGVGSGLGNRDLAGGGPVGSLWGVGEGQQAHTIVYVMDRSGSMAETFSLLQRELMRAIGSLDEEQLFNVIWFNEGPSSLLSERMLAATIDNKRVAFDAIDKIYPSGQTQPMGAIKEGLDFKPDVLFLLSDGDFGEDNERITRMIERRNENKATTINTILFVYDTVGDGERVLRAIAEANNGTFKHVTEEDVRR